MVHSSMLLLSRFSRVRLCATPETAATRLPRPWGSPGKNTGVGCHFLLQCMKVKSESEVAQSCLTLATPWIAAYQALPPMGFSRQEYWSGVPLPSPLHESQNSLYGILLVNILNRIRLGRIFRKKSGHITIGWN